MELLETTSRDMLENIQPQVVTTDDAATANSLSSSTSSSTSKNSQEIEHTTSKLTDEQPVVHASSTSDSIPNSTTSESGEGTTSVISTEREEDLQQTDDDATIDDEEHESEEKVESELEAVVQRPHCLLKHKDTPNSKRKRSVFRTKGKKIKKEKTIIKSKETEDEFIDNLSTLGLLQKRLVEISAKQSQRSNTRLSNTQHSHLPYVIHQLSFGSKAKDAVLIAALSYIVKKQNESCSVIERIEQMGTANYKSKRMIFAVASLDENDHAYNELKAALLDDIEKHLTSCFSNHTMMYPSLLLSEANGEIQGSHRDYYLDSGQEEKFTKMSMYDPRMSYSAIMAIDDFDWLWYPEDRMDSCRTISCTFPQLLLFSPMTVHAGSYYKEPRVRLFFYLVPKTDPIVKPKVDKIEFINFI